jgi:hypothetical protein
MVAIQGVSSLPLLVKTLLYGGKRRFLREGKLWEDKQEYGRNVG